MVQVRNRRLLDEQFEKLGKDVFSGLGRYFWRKVQSVVQCSEGFYTVIHDAVLENNNEALLWVRFQAEEPHQIRGLWNNN